MAPEDRKALQKDCDSVAREVRSARMKQASALLSKNAPRVKITYKDAKDMHSAMVPVRKAFHGRVIRRKRDELPKTDVNKVEMHTLYLTPTDREKKMLDTMVDELDLKNAKRTMGASGTAGVSTVIVLLLDAHPPRQIVDMMAVLAT